MKDFSYITHSSPAYIENLYRDYIQNPESVDPDFRKFFEGFDFAVTNSNGNGHAAVSQPTEKVVDSGQMVGEFAVYQLILAYRKEGHLLAKTNPIRERKDR